MFQKSVCYLRLVAPYNTLESRASKTSCKHKHIIMHTHTHTQSQYTDQAAERPKTQEHKYTYMF